MPLSALLLREENPMYSACVCDVCLGLGRGFGTAVVYGVYTDDTNNYMPCTRYALTALFHACGSTGDFDVCRLTEVAAVRFSAREKVHSFIFE